MKRIIDGKSYNTETAECIAYYESPHNRGDFHRFEEGLYRTKKGAWFIAGEGGALSKYSRPVIGGRGGGEGLEPLTEDQARQWLEEHNFVDELEEHFGSQIEEA